MHERVHLYIPNSAQIDLESVNDYEKGGLDTSAVFIPTTVDLHHPFDGVVHGFPDIIEKHQADQDGLFVHEAK